jgi:hypothetical protein
MATTVFTNLNLLRLVASFCPHTSPRERRALQRIDRFVRLWVHDKIIQRVKLARMNVYRRMLTGHPLTEDDLWYLGTDWEAICDRYALPTGPSSPQSSKTPQPISPICAQ